MATEQLVELYAIGTVKPTTLVWKEGMETWRTAFQIPQLAEALAKRGFKPPEDVPQDYDPFDESWGEASSAPHQAAPAPTGSVPPELSSALVGRPDNVRPTPGSYRIRSLSDFDEPTVAVDTGKLLSEVSDASELQTDTVRPPAEEPSDDAKTVARASPLSARRLQELAESLDRTLGEDEPDDDAKTVARQSPLLDSERVRRFAGRDGAARGSHDHDALAPARTSPLTETERARLSARLERFDTGRKPPPDAPTPAIGTRAVGRTAARDEPAPESPRPPVPRPAADARAGAAAAPEDAAQREEASSPAAASEPVSVRRNVDVGEPAEAPLAEAEPLHKNTLIGQPPAPIPEGTAPWEQNGLPSDMEGGDAVAAATAAAQAPAAAPPPKRGAGTAVAVTLLTLLLAGGAAAAGLVAFKPALVAKYVPFKVPGLRLAPADPLPEPQPSTGAPAGADPDVKPAANDSPERASAAAATDSAVEPADEAVGEAGAGKSIDQAEARRVLGIAAGGAAACKAVPRPLLRGEVEVTFAPSGLVEFVRVTGDVVGSAVEACVKANFHTIHVPPFEGGPVTVGRPVVIPARGLPPPPAAPKPKPQPESKPEPAEPEPGSEPEPESGSESEPTAPGPKPSEPAAPKPAEPAPAEPAPAEE